MIAPVKGKQYPERESYRAEHPEWCRAVQPMDRSLELMETECNAKLRKAGHSELIKEELVGGRMYTGPMVTKQWSTTLDAAMIDGLFCLPTSDSPPMCFVRFRSMPNTMPS